MSQLCRLQRAPSDLEDDIVLNEVYYIIDDMDETTFTFGSDRSIKIKAEVVLKTALDYAPERAGKAWLGRIIYATDGARERLLQTAELFFQEVLLPMKIRGLDRLVRAPPPLPKKDKDGLLAADSPPLPSPDSLTAQVLQRDGHACCVTGHSANRSLSKTTPNIIPVDDTLESTYIIPCSLSDSYDNHDNAHSTYDPCVFWEVVQHYAPSLDVEWLRSEGLNSPSNALTLSRTLQKAFVNLELFFTESPYFPGQFDVRNTIRDPWLGSTNFDAVTFTNHSTGSAKVPLPDKRLLRFHASISTMMRKTHARRVLDRTIKEAMHLEHFAENGSSDARAICMVLMTRVKTAVPYFD